MLDPQAVPPLLVLDPQAVPPLLVLDPCLAEGPGGYHGEGGGALTARQAASRAGGLVMFGGKPGHTSRSWPSIAYQSNIAS